MSFIFFRDFLPSEFFLEIEQFLQDPSNLEVSKRGLFSKRNGICKPQPFSKVNSEYLTNALPSKV